VSTVERSTVTVLQCESGRARTSPSCEPRASRGRVFLHARDITDAMRQQSPFAIEETFFGLVFRAL
jgi:hypothetical protein